MTNTLSLNQNRNTAARLAGIMLTTLLTMIISFSSAFAAQSGGWQNQEFKVNGSWSIEERADGNYLVVSDDFKTKSAPDLKFFFSKAQYGDLNGKNATDNAVFVAKLDGTKGGAAYKIPSNINVSDYNSLVLHCEQFSKLWASTPLK